MPKGSSTVRSRPAAFQRRTVCRETPQSAATSGSLRSRRSAIGTSGPAARLPSWVPSRVRRVAVLAHLLALPSLGLCGVSPRAGEA